MISFGSEICSHLESALTREWLETNGLGGFASSTIIGLNTRRYHALLTAATKPPVGRVVLLSKLEETLVIDGVRYALSANQYPGVVYPQGFIYLDNFRLDPFPTFTYRVAGIDLEKAVFMTHGENTTVIEYRVITRGAQARSLLLELAPLVAFRDFHSTTHQNGALNSQLTTRPGLAHITPYVDLPTLYFAHDCESLAASGYWYSNFEYHVERERGLDFVEDLFNPFVLRADLSSRASAGVIASTIPRAMLDAPLLRQAEIARRLALLDATRLSTDFTRSLAVAADCYIAQRGNHKTIIAGYPWFSDWGRDTMIALPGLTLATGRYDIAREILLAFAHTVDQGMLPNRFPDAGEAPEYNSIDATLWFFEAVRAYLACSGDFAFVRDHLYDVLRDIMAWHQRGTRHGIGVNDQGLLASGAPGLQLTWMDARVGDRVITPRYGMPVEIQALWYNALRVAESVAEQSGNAVDQRQFRALATRARSRFNAVFWNARAGCLYDVVNGGSPDASIRPNQILAVSLHHTMLSPARARQVVEVVQRELLTPMGLRTLSPCDPAYCPRYAGGPAERDAAYHQGTVWPWLLGPFIKAYLRVNEGAAAHQQAALWLAPLETHLREAGLGHISEVFDAGPPQRPGGCFAQAWSVAELLRCAVEDLGFGQPDAGAA